MSSRAKPERQPYRWPLLSLLGSKAVLYDQGCATVHNGLLLPPENRREQLEFCEAEIARGRSCPVDDLAWLPPGKRGRDFIGLCHRSARMAGGLWIHRLLGRDIPIEAFTAGSTGGVESADNFPLFIRVSESADFCIVESVDSPEGPAPRSGNKRRMVVFFNPLEQPELPVARAESERLYARLESTCQVDYIGRPQSSIEVQRLLNRYDVLFYFGHGKTIMGSPALPVTDGWLPVFSATGAGDLTEALPGIIFFLACLDGEPDIKAIHPGVLIYPVCRIGDRESEFFFDLIDGWTAGPSFLTAWRHALRQDFERGDIRRFIWRIGGWNEPIMKKIS